VVDPIGGLPFTAPGLSVIGVLCFIIAYLFRLNAVDRRDANARLSTVESEHAAVLIRERADREREREWLRDFYENRIGLITERYEGEVKGLRTEVAELHRDINSLRTGLDHERRLRYEAEERLHGAETVITRLQGGQVHD
jgi:uncharacterized membrane protein